MKLLNTNFTQFEFLKYLNFEKLFFIFEIKKLNFKFEFLNLEDYIKAFFNKKIKRNRLGTL